MKEKAFKEFAAKAKEDGASFTVMDGEETLHFSRVPFGKGSLIYLFSEGYSEHSYPPVYIPKMSLVAAINETGELRVSGKWIAESSGEEADEFGAKTFEEEMCGLNDYMLNEFFLGYYAAMKEEEKPSPLREEKLRRLAKEMVLYKTVDDPIRKKELVTKDFWLSYFCGIWDINDTAEAIQSYARHGVVMYTKSTLAKEYAKRPDILTDDERRIFEAIEGKEARAVNVIFERGGKCFSLKINTESLYDVIIYERNFIPEDFVNHTKALVSLLEFGVGPEELTCNDIRGLKYKQVIIYERKKGE